MAVRPALVQPLSAFNTQSAGINQYLQTPAAEIYPHQREAVNSTREYFERPDHINIGLVVLPTGCGKTGVAVLSAYALNASRVLVITPSATISSQIHEAFCSRANNFLKKRGIFEMTNEIYQTVVPSGALINTSKWIVGKLPSPLMVVNAHKIGGQSRVRIEDIPKEGYDLVIVDEAHHYPADTWRLLINHFENSKRLFLTATPDRNGRRIAYLPTGGGPEQEIPICYRLDRNEAVRQGIIRDIRYEEVGQPGNEDEYMRLIADKIKETLIEHDRQDPSIKHQAMVLTQQKENLNGAMDFERIYGNDCNVYITDSPPSVLIRFNSQIFSTLIIIGRLLEGYDNHNVSVVAIVRNVARSSRVLFTQFVGRAVRKARIFRPGDQVDPVEAVLISHVKYNQRQNFENFDKIADDDNLDDD